jgi:hypothetical protein
MRKRQSYLARQLAKHLRQVTLSDRPLRGADSPVIKFDDAISRQLIQHVANNQVHRWLC